MTFPFYESDPDETFRFGDIVTGFTIVTPSLKTPTIPAPTEYEISITHTHAAVLSPCCSIRDGTILLSPLLQIRTNWLKNPYFADDLTRINTPMSAQQARTPQKWEELPPEQKVELANSPSAYAELRFFIYEKHPLLPTYFVKLRNTIDKIELGYYMIDFLRLYRVKCSAIHSPTDCPIHAKILQLSIPVRRDLRTKLISFFREPEEDSFPQATTPPAGLASQDRGSQFGAD